MVDYQQLTLPDDGNTGGCASWHPSRNAYKIIDGKKWYFTCGRRDCVRQVCRDKWNREQVAKLIYDMQAHTWAGSQLLTCVVRLPHDGRDDYNSHDELLRRWNVFLDKLRGNRDFEFKWYLGRGDVAQWHLHVIMAGNLPSDAIKRRDGKYTRVTSEIVRAAAQKAGVIFTAQVVESIQAIARYIIYQNVAPVVDLIPTSAKVSQPSGKWTLPAAKRRSQWANWAMMLDDAIGEWSQRCEANNLQSIYVFATTPQNTNEFHTSDSIKKPCSSGSAERASDSAAQNGTQSTTTDTPPQTAGTQHHPDDVTTTTQHQSGAVVFCGNCGQSWHVGIFGQPPRHCDYCYSQNAAIDATRWQDVPPSTTLDAMRHGKTATAADDGDGASRNLMSMSSPHELRANIPHAKHVSPCKPPTAQPMRSQLMQGNGAKRTLMDMSQPHEHVANIPHERHITRWMPHGKPSKAAMPQVVTIAARVPSVSAAVAIIGNWLRWWFGVASGGKPR